MAQRFSSRFGHRSRSAKISIREDAPADLRAAVLQITNEEVDFAPSHLRRIVCKVLQKRPDSSNWSEFPNVWDEVQELAARCDWFKVYDIIEAIWEDLEYERAEKFVRELNE